MDIENLPSRTALAQLAAEKGFHDCAEIGVLEGKYSEKLCQNIPDIHLICVDTWLPSRNHPSARRLARHFETAKRALSAYNVRFMRMTSMEAALLIDNESLDFVYIDALHDYYSVTADMNAWIPKLRNGGIIAGHDWTHNGVHRAVTRYMYRKRITKVYVTQNCEEDYNPSWFWFKNA